MQERKTCCELAFTLAGLTGSPRWNVRCIIHRNAPAGANLRMVYRWPDVETVEMVSRVCRKRNPQVCGFPGTCWVESCPCVRTTNKGGSLRGDTLPCSLHMLKCTPAG